MTPEIKTEIPSLLLRLPREEGAEELSLRVDQNREHFRRWMPWLDGAKDTSDQLKFIKDVHKVQPPERHSTSPFSQVAKSWNGFVEQN